MGTAKVYVMMNFSKPIRKLIIHAFFVCIYCAQPTLAEPSSTDDAAIILEGMTTAAARIVEFQEDYGAGYRSGSIHASEGELVVSWPTNSGKRVRGQASIIGSFAKAQNTWLWAWDNQTVPSSFAQVSFSIRDFSRTNGIDTFLRSPQIASLSYAEELASIAVLFDEYELIFAQERQGTIIFLAVENIAWQADR